jgi:hypothetical protein
MWNDRIGYSMLTIQSITLNSHMVYNTLPINPASYINASFHNSTSHVTNNYGKINEISVRYSSVNAHDLASYVANNYR